MSLVTIKSALFAVGREALIWAPVASIAIDNPTILLTAEAAYAAFHLREAYYAKNKFNRHAALSNAALFIASPLTYHPRLTAWASTSVRGSILTAIGINNVLSGCYETVSVLKNMTMDTWSPLRNTSPVEENKSTIGKLAGLSLRLGLGLLRIFGGKNQVQSGLNLISFNVTQAYSQSELPKTSSHNPGQGNCFPKKETRHPEDIAFYNHALKSKKLSELLNELPSLYKINKYESDLPYPSSINNEGRCDIILELPNVTR